MIIGRLLVVEHYKVIGWNSSNVLSALKKLLLVKEPDGDSRENYEITEEMPLSVVSGRESM
ncbi:MAG: hypothetical protein WBF77_04200 [Sulfurimonadaceae bacterium]